MNNMRLSNDMTDITLLVGDREIPGHRVILAASSAYFHAMFTSMHIICVFSLCKKMVCTATQKI